ncbi:MAG: nitrous oxide reductase accessory protein NosL [Ilyomonas sp.]
MNNKLKRWVRIATAVCGIALLAVLYFPIWQIQLNAPQYPEGLVLLIFAGKLGGSVDIVNGLNHYIGMKTLHADDFVEFTVLPYIIIFFSILFIVIAIINRKRFFYSGFALFVLFGIVAMIDFWRWEYNYGHDLDPNAAIRVPGMAYQPPLIGYKQLLNFGAYSIPDIGGWIFLAVGVILFAGVVFEIRSVKTKVMKTKPVIAFAALLLVFSTFMVSCNAQPQPIEVGKDACSYCKMTISDARFGGEALTQKGKVYKFDDAHCLLAFLQQDETKKNDIKTVYVVDFNSHKLIPATNAFFYKSEELRSPMNGNIAAFSSEGDLQRASSQWKGEEVKWSALLNK